MHDFQALMASLKLQGPYPLDEVGQILARCVHPALPCLRPSAKDVTIVVEDAQFRGDARSLSVQDDDEW